MTACLPTERWLVQGSRTTTRGSRLSLTFDDGPHPEHTPAVLEALARWHTVATFFIVGDQAARYPEIVRQIVEAGHFLGNHTWSHGEPRQTSATEFLREVEQTSAWLDTEVGVRPYWMRPPKGELTWNKFTGLWRQGYGIALWNVDPRDYRMTSRADAQRWVDQYVPQPGDILLLHDKQPWSATIVDALGDRGVFTRFRSCNLDEWSHRGTPMVRQRVVLSHHQNRSIHTNPQPK
jgi:peptidoglycan-N-acetylglucosamine deacetylase